MGSCWQQIRLEASGLSSGLAWAFAVVAAVSHPSLAQELAVPRGAFVRAIQNQQAAFRVRVDVDREDRAYRYGDKLTASVKSQKAGYLYVLYRDSNGRVSLLFPNKYDKDNKIAADDLRRIPPVVDPQFEIEIGPPTGSEQIRAVVTGKPLKLPREVLEGDPLKEIDLNLVKGAAVVANGGERVDFAEHFVELRVVDEDTDRSRKPQRVALFIGIGEYNDKSIPPLSACSRDAELMRNTMTPMLELNKTFSLINMEATRANIVKHFGTILPSVTMPGDTVLIYWSGHGGRCADTNGDEIDGLDEFLVTYDTAQTGIGGIPESALLDDEFGRLIQDLDGRRVCVILDTCHSGGQAAAEDAKAIGGPALALANGQFDMFDSEIAQVKDIGQKHVAMLASSKGSERSFMQRDGRYSVMTKQLDQLLHSDKKPLTIRGVEAPLQQMVGQYMKTNFPNERQTPQAIDNDLMPFVLRP